MDSYVFLGASGLKVSPLCLGTMNFGQVTTAATQCTEEESHAILDAYVAAGGNFIDCADVYQKGESERILGRWLQKHPELRSKLVIATKARGAVDPATAGPNDVGLSRSHIMQAVEDSLARLQLKYIDLYQMHVWDSGAPIEETLRALDDLIKAGKIRYVGWSNLMGWQMQLIASECKRLGLNPPVSLQEQYSLMCRSTEYEVVPACEHNGIGLLPWSPLKGGWLSGKITRTSGIPENSRIAWAEAAGSKLQSHPGFSAFKDDEHVWQLIDGLQELATAVGGTVAQVAIRWLLHKRAVTSVVIGPKNVAQLADNLACLRFSLTREQVARLDELSATSVPYPYELVNRLNLGRTHAVAADKY